MTDTQTEAELVEFWIDEQTSVMVEVQEERRGSVQVGARSDRYREARDLLVDDLERIRDAARATLSTLRDAAHPDEIKLGFAVKFTTEAGAVIARTALEGNFTVELLWKKASDAQESP